MWDLFKDLWKTSTAFKVVSLLIVGGLILSVIVAVANQDTQNQHNQPPQNLVQKVLPNVAVPGVVSNQVNAAAQQAQQQAQPTIDKAKQDASILVDKAKLLKEEAAKKLQQFKNGQPSGGLNSQP